MNLASTTSDSASSTLSPDERQERILALLGEHGRLPVNELARLFSTSEDSVRRDLRLLERSGRVRRVHGAVLPAAVPATPFSARGGDRQDAKADIAAAASRFFADGTTVFVDGGTTTLAVVRAIPRDRRLTVATASVPAADALADHPGVGVIVIGGRLDKASRTAIGAGAVAAIREIRADLAVLGLCSIDPFAGIAADGYEEAEVKRAMVESASTVLAVATPEKIGRASPFHIAPVSAVDRLVTTDEAPSATLRALADAGIDVIVA